MDNRAYAIPTPILQRARALIIVNQFKAGAILGVTGGYGVILVKRPNQTWSLPVMLEAGEASLGFQLGGKSVETIYVITDDETPRLLFDSRFKVGVDAKAVAGPRWTEIETVNRDFVSAPVLVYTKSKGLFAGATVKAGVLARDDDSNLAFYRTNYTMPELLYGDFVKPPAEVQPLMAYVQRLAP
jgi:lipid-binding SYLF domain-containing protein